MTMQLLPDDDALDAIAQARAARDALVNRMADDVSAMLFTLAQKYGNEPDAEAVLCELFAGVTMARVSAGVWTREAWIATAEAAAAHWASPLGQQQIAAASAQPTAAGGH